jgi:hypothetical protein
MSAMPSFEIIFRLTLRLFGDGIRNHRYASQHPERELSSLVKMPLTKKICDTPGISVRVQGSQLI